MSEIEQPHDKIDSNSRHMMLLNHLSRDWETLPEIRCAVDFESADRYVHDLRRFGFVDRQAKDGEKVKYRISVLGMGVRKHHQEHN